jgi:hypothetical protein
MARFDAEELHLWVLEVPAPRSGSPKGSAGASPTQAGEPEKPRFTVIPQRMFAAGHVTLRSPQLDADTARLEAWFIHRPPEPRLPPDPAAPIDPRAPLREPVARVAWQQNQPLPTLPTGVIRPPSLQKFHVNGELVQLQLVIQGQEFDVEDLLLRGHATIDETRTETPGQDPIHIGGELLELRHGTTPDATIEVTGEPAEVAGRGLSLIGRKINVHRGQNRMWIDGPGEATLPAPDGDSLSLTPATAPAPPPVVREPGPAAALAVPPERLHLVWQKGLVFDGLTATFEGEVQARTATQVALTQTLQATMSQRIDFNAASAATLKQRPELARLRLDGGVFIESRGYDKAGQKTSHDQMQVPNLTIDRSAGTLHADGPGWVSTVRKNEGLPGSPLAPRPAAPAPPGAPPKPPLSSVHVAFERTIEGDLAQRKIWFEHQVRTTYSPAYEFTDLIKAEQKADLGQQGVLMESDRLMLTELRLSPTQTWIEMEASGNTHIVGHSFDVSAVRVRYTSNKELLTIEGDGRADAQVWYTTIPGQPQQGYAAARRFRYWVREEAFEGDGFSAGSFEFLGGKLKLPGARR